MKPWLSLLILLSLTACSDGAGKAQLQDYQARLSRVLALDVDNTMPSRVIPLPARSELQQSLPDIRLDITDALATRQCALDQLIAERNSSLGRVFTLSKQLDYELRLLARLEQCLAQDWPPALQQQLDDIYQQKLQSIEPALNNMLYGDDTLRQQWHGKHRMLTGKEQNAFHDTMSALSQLVHVQQAIRAQDWSETLTVDIEQALSNLYRHDFLAQLQYSLRYSQAWFSVLNPALHSVAPASLCPQQRSTEQLHILTTVFHKYFIGEVQAYLAQLSFYQQEIWPLIATLYQHSALYPSLEQRYSHSATELRQSILQHVHWYQQLNQQCPVGLTAPQAG